MGLRLKNHRIFLLIFLLFLVTRVFSLFARHDIWWDSSVYAGMGKYIYSFGNAGLWEPSRPVVWPLILGFFWKIGLNYIFLGKLLSIIFSLGILLLTYFTAYKLFNKKTAVVSALFLSLSPTFFLFSDILHSEIPSAFFVLCSFCFFISKKYNYSGIFSGIAFMTRFFQIFAFIPLILLLTYLIMKKKESVKSLAIFLIFFIIPVVPYLMLNYVLYNNIVYPFLLQSWMSENTGWVFFRPFYFYFVSLAKDNVLALFSVLAMAFIFKKPSLNKIAIVLVFLFAFVPYNLVAHKEMRFLIAALPFLYILSSYGVFYFVGLFKKNKNLLLSLLLIIFLISNVPKLKFDKYGGNFDVFYDYVDNEKIDNGLWVSNPAFIAFSDKKADELIYYPLYNSEKIDALIGNIGNAKQVLINTCDLLPCPPYDNLCNKKHDSFISLLKEKFNAYYYSKYNQCEYYIFN